MNKINCHFRGTVLLSLLSGIILGLYGCSGPANSTLQAKDLPSQYEGQAVIFKNLQTGDVDTVKVEGGAFCYTIPVDTTSLYYIDIEGNNSGYVSFIAEGGVHQFKAKDNADGFHIVGGYLNTELKNMISKSSELEGKQSVEAMKILDDTTLSDDELREAHNAQTEAYDKMRYELFSDYLARHPQNAVGMEAFARLKYKSDEDFIEAYEAQSEVVKRGFAPIRRYEKILNAQRTQEGGTYLDFEINTIEGKTIKFSDFMEDGKYLLVDFWASWCVPCRKILPYMKKMVERLPADKLTMLSIGCYDKPEPYQKAVEEEEIPWNQVLDVNSTGAELYGVKSIPHFVLISPEGKIIKRASNILHVEAVLNEKLLN